MTDAELLDQFVLAEKTATEVRIRVRQIRWPQPHTPTGHWNTAMRLPASSSDAEIQQAREGLLDDPAYFLRCQECGTRNPLGWMHGSRICQGCAQHNHGIVY